jgi:DNA repair protein RadD
MTGALFRRHLIEPRALRPYQAKALDLLRQSLMTGHRRPLVQAPTGFGKTLLAAEVIKGALAKGNRIIFTVPALSLIEQTVAAFEAEGIDAIGVMQGMHRRTDARQPVQVASIQTLARRKRPQADLVVIDEAHRMFDSVNAWISDPAWPRSPSSVRALRLGPRDSENTMMI